MRYFTAEDIEGRPLTEEEKGWLRQRERFAEVNRNEELFGREVVAGSGEIEVGTGHKPDTESDGDNYDQWKIKELREEGEARVPPVDFTGCTLKEHFVLAMRAWDMEHPETTEE